MFLAVADIHGAYKALKQVLQRSEFNYERDTLLCLGDTADGWTQTKECFDELLKIPNLIYIMGNHDCLDVETECLTEAGWKWYTDINKDDKILSLNPITNSLEWSSINSIIIKDYCGEMISIRGGGYDLLTTPTHRIPNAKKSKNTISDLRYTYAKDISGLTFLPISKNNIKKPYPISNNLLKLIAWILTDGSVIKKKNGTIDYFIYQSKYVDTIRNLLTEMNDKFFEYKRNAKENRYICGKKIKSEKDAYTFKVSKNLSKELKRYITEKYNLPKWLYNISQEQFKIFLNELICGNGSFYKHTKKSYILYGKKEQLEDIQILCIMNGHSATLRPDNGKSYRLNICKREYVQVVSRLRKSTKDYNNKVWCLNVPHSNFVIRRNGNPCITGNCWLYNWIRFGDTPEEWLTQGGANTIYSYVEGVPLSHRRILDNAVYYHILYNNLLFVHGGVDINLPIEAQNNEVLMWDRTLFNLALLQRDSHFHFLGMSSIFIGHTATTNIEKTIIVPIRAANVWFLDTGCGWDGRLTGFDILSGKFWQSDLVQKLYNVKEHF